MASSKIIGTIPTTLEIEDHSEWGLRGIIRVDGVRLTAKAFTSDDGVVAYLAIGEESLKRFIAARVANRTFTPSAARVDTPAAPAPAPRKSKKTADDLV